MSSQSSVLPGSPKLSQSSHSSQSSQSSQSSYIKDDLDLCHYIENFMNNEAAYFEFIQSYCLGDQVELYIQTESTVHYENNKLIETLRNSEVVNISHDTIQNWVYDYYGEIISNRKLMDNVFIGVNKVPLWKILVDSVEEDSMVEQEKEEEEEEGGEDIYTNNKCFLRIITMLMLSMAISLYLILLLIVIEVN